MPKTSSTSRLPQIFSQIWHLPDRVRWMDPLPPLHRRGIIFAFLVLLLAFLWPTPTLQPPQPHTTLNSGQGSGTEVPVQADADMQSEPAVTEQPQARSEQPQTRSEQPQTKNDSQGTWRNYQIAAGQTLAQLFRDNNLPVNDVFAMARVEGDDKPLSSLQTGQAVRIRLNAQGIVNGLTVDTSNGQILFTRQPDGAFVRAQ